MKLTDFPFTATDWSRIGAEVHAGTSGTARWRTQCFGTVRVRMVEYSAGYVADHWCSKGHILLCLAGEMVTELQDGRRIVLTAGMTYQVADDVMPHRSSTRDGASLFIVD